MAVRRAINRYKTSPSGYDYEKVLKKAKSFYRASGEFQISPFFSKEGVLWSAETITNLPFVPVRGTRKYVFENKTNRWNEV